MTARTAWIVDDLPQTRAWLRQALTLAFGELQVVEAASLAAAQRAQLGHGWPDLALVDLHLPDGHGNELIARLHRARPDACVLVPTIFDDDAHLFEAICAGAAGHLLKDQPVEVLADLLRAHDAGAAPTLSPSLARRILRALDAGGADIADTARHYLQQRARGVAATEALARTPAVGAAVRAAVDRLRR